MNEKFELEKIIISVCQAAYARGKDGLPSVIVSTDLSSAITSINSLLSSRHAELIKKVEALREEINSWNCDNVNCGNGAICNFCALKQKVLAMLKEGE